MKFSILITTALFPLFTLAGGGGGLRPTMKVFSQDMSSSRPTSAEAVFLIGQKDETVLFAYGKWDGQAWKVKSVQINSTFPMDEKLETALSESGGLGSWVNIK